MKAIFRLWLGGDLVMRKDYEIDHPCDVTGLCVEHSDLVCEDARPWRVEVEFPEMPADERFMRFGTDLLPRMRAS